MFYQINEETINKTTRCNHKFKCLDDNKRDVCAVDICFGGNGCFLKTAKPDYCTYKNTFGGSYVCYCPTRHELFKKYNI